MFQHEMDGLGPSVGAGGYGRKSYRDGKGDVVLIYPETASFAHPWPVFEIMTRRHSGGREIPLSFHCRRR
ncbi:MAG TPA: hypothetical protein PK752_16195 [Accumulibacter sp.]|uniref:hypothetical protein n=1 Tax=Accumulibacter sp. TaxID=2053492 RepID=UPI002C3221D0|nr:hypothetical protein [Accumulibacter sp.]HRD89779.1 hypothetical protein [Accumulibacter sp.]